MTLKERKSGVAVFVLAATWYLAGMSLGDIGEDGVVRTNAPEPQQIQSFRSEPVAASAGATVVLDFEDLPPVSPYGRLPSGYAGLDWDCYYEGDPDWWDWKSNSLSPGYSQPHSGDNYLFNAFGANHLGFSLPNVDDRLVGAWFASAPGSGGPATAVRFDGYNGSHILVQQSPWLTLSTVPQYLAANFDPVARIEVEIVTESFYSMDDLTYHTGPICTPPAEPANPDPCDGAMDVAVDTNLTWGQACTAHCELDNGGFETGGFTPWVPVTGPGSQLTPWNVSSGGTGYLGGDVPFEGSYFAQNGFDGEAGLYYDLYQETEIPACATSAILSWSERIQWIITGGAGQPRQYTVSVQPAGGGAPLAVLFAMNLNPGTTGDTGYVSHNVDLIAANPAIAGQKVRINFHEYIPETFTGPAQFDLDGISLACSSNMSQTAARTRDRNEMETEYARIAAGVTAASSEQPAEYDFGEHTRDANGQIAMPVVVSQSAVVPSAAGQIVNGDFETGDLSGWTLANSGSGSFVINNGTYDPPGPDGPLPPYSGSFSALGIQSGPSLLTIYQDVALPADATSAVLRWVDRIRNQGDEFDDPEQEFRVEIRDTGNNLLATLFSTNPGDPLMSGWTERSADISAFAGKTIRVTFTVEDNLYYFNVHLDDIRIESAAPPTSRERYDVYFGMDPCAMEMICEDINQPLCDPTPGPDEVLNAATTYYWQVVAKNDCNEETAGKVWSFTTAGRPPDCSGAFASISELWPPNHKWVDVEILGVVDPDGDPVTITVTGITQDEPVIDAGSGNTAPDGQGVGTSTARLRAERSGLGNGRVYEISFDADDGKGGVCSGSVKVCVPHDRRMANACIDDGQSYDSTATNVLSADFNHDGVINQLDFAIFAGSWLKTYDLDE